MRAARGLRDGNRNAARLLTARCCSSDAEGLRRRYQSDAESTQHYHSSDTEGLRRWYQSDAEGTQHYHSSDAEGLRRRYQSDAEGLRRRYQSEAEGLRFLTVSRRALPGLKVATRLRGMEMLSPVRGLRPLRASRSLI